MRDYGAIFRPQKDVAAMVDSGFLALLFAVVGLAFQSSFVRTELIYRVKFSTTARTVLCGKDGETAPKGDAESALYFKLAKALQAVSPDLLRSSKKGSPYMFTRPFHRQIASRASNALGYSPLPSPAGVTSRKVLSMPFSGMMSRESDALVLSAYFHGRYDPSRLRSRPVHRTGL